MPEWKEWIDEKGLDWWLNEEHGNIVRVSDNMYVAIVPKTFKLGPFKDLTEAKKTVENNELGRVIDEYNLSLVKK